MNSNTNQEPEATTIIGAKSENAVIIGADKQSTGIRQMKVEKLAQIHPNSVIGSAGLVADIDDFVSDVHTRVKEYRIKRGRDMSYDSLMTTIGDTINSSTGPYRAIPDYLTSIILAGYDDAPRLGRVSRIGTKKTEEPFLAVGSGEAVARGSLGSSYEEGLETEEVEKIVMDALKEAADQGPYTGIGIDLAVIDSEGVQMKEDLTIEKD